ncbi:hypothetical protein B0J11DRAFT_540448 [Dendryphion nanum]|uniref:UBL3-like ubiquitin domain-containing protein n=1 Tax=Dendryphion nanum TaxID=256645 RepID=A0A9P9IAI6_9PLEO|nr:hypothetical protein B0J11DRAFT_540448 [Dendryphion nanum]
MATTSDMPSTATTAATTTLPQPAAPQQTNSRPGSGHEALSTSPVEMRTLPASVPEPTTANTTTAAPLEPSSIPESTPQTQETRTTQEPNLAVDSPTASPVTAKPTPPAELNRIDTEAIGPSSDTPATKPDNSNGPVVVITLLLTTGARHPYKIDEKYLKKRNVNVEAMDPYNISVYTLKELIWRDWREEWEPRPTAPSSIRLIHFGRMLDDKSPLKGKPTLLEPLGVACPIAGHNPPIACIAIL